MKEQNKYTNEDDDEQNEDDFDNHEHEQQQLRMIFEHSNITINLL